MSIQRYTNRTTPDGVWLDKADDGDWVLYADHLAAIAAERERADRAEAEAVEAWRQVHLLKAETAGPDGFATWKDAATDERLRRVKAEAERDALRERVARLVGAIEDAPHEYSCKALIEWNRPGRGNHLMDESICNCFKRTALGDK